MVCVKVDTFPPPGGGNVVECAEYSFEDSAKKEISTFWVCNKMAICGHQFQGGDESDWVLSTSAGCLDGSTTASRILQELFKKKCQSLPSKTPIKRPKTVTSTLENPSNPNPNAEVKGEAFVLAKEQNENLIVKRITGIRPFENFDESQHLNGCPMKWLYQKKLMEKHKISKMGRLCYKNSIKKDEVKSEKKKNLRDKTPIEVKIHKINLIEKYTNNCDDICTPFIIRSVPPKKVERDSKNLEMRRKKLAAKLNWKLHDESQEDSSPETRHNYLPPRPLLGLKPLLSLLLAPHQQTNCYSLIRLKDTSRKKKEPSLSIQSLNLPTPHPEYKSRPSTTNTLRWGCKSSMLAKKFQLPNQITIRLDQHENKPTQTHIKVLNHSPPVKKSNERAKQPKSLSSLFYELKGKTNIRNQNEKHFDEMARDLTMEEGHFKIKRFLSLSPSNSDFVQACKTDLEKRKKSEDLSLGGDSELNLVCERVRFFEKKSSRAGKQTKSESGEL